MCLAKTIAQTQAIATTHNGTVTGIQRPINKPVTRALPSLSVVHFRVQQNSDSKEAATAVANTRIVREPISNTLTTHPGTSASDTRSMIPDVVNLGVGLTATGDLFAYVRRVDLSESLASFEACVLVLRIYFVMHVHVQSD